MNNRRRTRLALLAGLTVALAGGVLLVSGVAFAVVRSCTVSSGTSVTGREWGTIEPSTKTPGLCFRRRVGGDAPAGFPSCHEVGKQDLGCITIVDVP